ncbi:DNA-binding MarR family transcriptional regulator [Methylopila capsulata]|uniref:DNA-binding MarR family transcriptional regulator n=1 Tax=Methylopila capsulata TaxID=61654 RepID=A0A9W6IS86_9HYPH|nr:MarR family winged helix-turn-helix transcriptional regulator [Methylopila capsulata]MBM7851227.1 DNA-binding MarR family transcriptional regulator [Methylopila capsulata]GLK54285.1 hypothetical protein GCM10008170_03040 [Methylopila capsulata]
MTDAVVQTTEPFDLTAAETGNLFESVIDIALAIKAIATHLSEMEALKAHGLTFEDYCVLNAIAAAPGRKAAAIAREVGQSRQRFQQISDDFRARGLIQKASSEETPRAKLLTLTETGRAAIEAVAAQGAALDVHLDPRELRHVAIARRALVRLDRSFAEGLGLRTKKDKKAS